MSESLYRLENLRHRYDSRDILHIPALTVEKGEIFAILGPSGAGKSTLLRLLALLEEPSSGTLNLNLNERVICPKAASLDERRQLTMVFQKPALLSRTVWDNIAYGLTLRGQRENSARIEQTLQRVHLIDLVKAYPRTLSGGEVQRVALARALVLEPQILLLDEPTANLDPANASLIENLIREQCEKFGTTIVLVTHNLFQARRLATRTGLLIQGELVEIAQTDEFFNQPKSPLTKAFLSGELVY